MGVDSKYGVAVTDVEGHSPIGEDEPIFIFRAQDANSVPALEAYAEKCIEKGTSSAHLEAIGSSIDNFRRWQEENRDKVRLPD